MILFSGIHNSFSEGRNELSDSVIRCPLSYASYTDVALMRQALRNIAGELSWGREAR